MATMAPEKRNAAKQHAPKRLDIACGQRTQPGFTGMDIAGEPDISWDLNELPWPIRSSSVEEAHCSHYVEHIPHWRPGWDRDGWWLFFDELHRIMKPEGTVEIIHPYVMSVRAFWDPTHTRFIHENTWSYLDPAWREANGLDHYPVSADFEVVTMDGLGIDMQVLTRHDTAQAFMRTHYWNVIADLRVLLKARKS